MYIDIFDEIVDIMRNDYAGCIDKKDGTHLTSIENEYIN